MNTRYGDAEHFGAFAMAVVCYGSIPYTNVCPTKYDECPCHWLITIKELSQLAGTQEALKVFLDCPNSLVANYYNPLVEDELG